MTDTKELLPVTQADIDCANEFWRLSVNWGSMEDMRQLVARHRTEGVRELVEAAKSLLKLVDRNDIATWLVTEHPAEWANAGDAVQDARLTLAKFEQLP